MFKYYQFQKSIFVINYDTVLKAVRHSSQVRVLRKDENVTKPIIKCKRPALNYYEGTNYKKFEEIPLASKGWLHRKSKGDHFTIYPAGQTNDLTSNSEPIPSFDQLHLQPSIIEVLNSINIRLPTRIQADAIPELLTGRNCVIAAETGCGKTLAYLLPIVQQILERRFKMKERNLNSPIALVLLPGRELAEQIGQLAEHFADHLNFKTKTIIGGRTKRLMLDPSFEDTDLLIATLGAISKLTTTGIYRMDCVQHLVMDEADTLLDDSFNEKLKHFCRRFPLQYGGYSNEQGRGTQLTLVSATMPTSISNVLGEIIPPESLVNIRSANLHKVLTAVPQKFIRLGRSEKAMQLLRIVKSEHKKHPIMIFSNKSATCDWISMFLNSNGIKCVNLNGDMAYALRIGKYNEFRDSSVNVISCTDIGSRGLDTVRVNHVLNYDFPLHTADYIHRCGRTGRVGSSSNCQITNFISGPREVDVVRKIELSIRKANELPNVNGNITQVINDKVLRNIREDISKIR